MIDDDIESRLKILESKINQIADRNARVQVDKAWEISQFRVFSICILTWFVSTIVFWIIGVQHAVVNAIIPMTGFYLSTLSLPFLKKFWASRYFD